MRILAPTAATGGGILVLSILATKSLIHAQVVARCSGGSAARPTCCGDRSSWHLPCCRRPLPCPRSLMERSGGPRARCMDARPRACHMSGWGMRDRPLVRRMMRLRRVRRMSSNCRAGCMRRRRRTWERRTGGTLRCLRAGRTSARLRACRMSTGRRVGRTRGCFRAGRMSGCPRAGRMRSCPRTGGRSGCPRAGRMSGCPRAGRTSGSLLRESPQAGRMPR
jgi:hypothetical protein